MLAVITEYDGDFDAYIQDFVAKVGPIFDVLLSFTVGGKEVTPVAQHISAFIAYVKQVRRVAANRARRASTRPTRRPCSRFSPRSANYLRRRCIDYADVQGTVLRGYRVDLARHFVLSVTDAARARAFIGHLVDGTGGVPRITTAARWTEKPECFVNIGFTCAGLAALGVTPAELATFDLAFQRGATDPDSAAAVGDVGESAPANWIGGLADGARVHIVLNLWVHEDAAVLEKVSARLRTAFAGAMTELSAHDAQALPDNFVHFGYHDNIAQPTVDGAPPRKRPVPDDQPVVPTGEFLLGYHNAYGSQYTVQPSALSTNSSYAAFRILEQDVAGFEQFLTTSAAKAGIDPELLAAKVCGRWRNGNPLELAPDAPGTTLPMSAVERLHLRRHGGRREGRHAGAALSDRFAHPPEQPAERGGGRHRRHASSHRAARHALRTGLRSRASRHDPARTDRLLHQRQPHEPVRVRARAMEPHARIS